MMNLNGGDGQRTHGESEGDQQAEQGGTSQQTGISSRNAQRVQNLVFPVTIVLDRSFIEVNGSEVSLTPGMTVTAEITTGDRRIIQYLFSRIADIASERYGRDDR